MQSVQNDDLDTINELVAELFPGEAVREVIRQGGMTNHTYAVQLSGGCYIFRLPGLGTESLIDRNNEKISAELASELNIDTELNYFNAETGVKIARYIRNAVTMSPFLMRKEENMQAAADVFRCLHHCGRDTGVFFDVFQMAKGYEELIQKYKGAFYPDYEDIRRKIIAIKDKADKDTLGKVPCHNDPLCENWIQGEGRMFLVDWEYAGMNDPMWDLADLSIEAEYSPELDEKLLKMYLKRAAAEKEIFHFRANKIFLDFLWSLWGKARVPFSGSEMEEYALMRYLRMKKNLKIMNMM